MLRWSLSLLLAALVALASFVVILWLVSPSQPQANKDPVQVGYFVPMSKNSDSQTRSRLQPPPPPPQPEQPAEQAPTPVPTQMQLKLDITAPSLASNIRISAVTMPSTSNLPVATTPTEPMAAPEPMGLDADVIPLNDVLPEYPDHARRRNIEGYVKLAFTINAKGRVENIQVVESSPPNVFDRSARQAAARWRFNPRTENGVPVARRAEKIIDFKLTQ